IRPLVGKDYIIGEYHEHALTSTSKSQAVAYVCLQYGEGKKVWGVGIHNDIIAASVSALVSAINKMLKD
ncbi:MAG: alpha-isopropylmalate synthase regulatory domain-containing protein, partial [Christensenellales bacterium]